MCVCASNLYASTVNLAATDNIITRVVALSGTTRIIKMTVKGDDVVEETGEIEKRKKRNQITPRKRKKEVDLNKDWESEEIKSID